MSKPVLFATGVTRYPGRAENLYTLYEAYKGSKEFLTTRSWDFQNHALSGMYGLLVTDVFPMAHPCKTIMIWHAIQGGKKIGLDEKLYYKAEQAEYFDCIVAAGHGGVDMLHQCTNVPKEKILNLGMPRTDRYIGKKKGDGCTDLARKRSYLYSPTFRHPHETPLPEIDWEYLDNELTDDELFVVKPHPFGVHPNLDGMKHIKVVNKMLPSASYLYDCDVVITDYSTIMFDGYLLNKPCVLFEKNQGYVTSRGMYLSYPDKYSSRYATDERQLLQLARSADKLTNVERECIDYVADKCDGHSCERIIDLIYEMNGG